MRSDSETYWCLEWCLPDACSANLAVITPQSGTPRVAGRIESADTGIPSDPGELERACVASLGRLRLGLENPD